MTREIVESGPRSQRRPNDTLEQGPPGTRSLSWLGFTIALVCVGSAALWALGVYRFGSVPSAIAYVRGDRLIPDSYSKSFGAVDKAQRPQVEFSLSNWTSQRIRILGGDVSCSCLVTTDLPLVIPAGGRATLRATARSKSKSGPYAERLRLMTEPPEVGLVLVVRGVFQ